MITIYRNGINVIGVRICKDPPWACFYHEIHWHQYWYLKHNTCAFRQDFLKATSKKNETGLTCDETNP